MRTGVSSKRVTIVSVLLLSGCAATPYVEGGLGWSFDSSNFAEDESGVSGRLGIGIEFDEERWYIPSECSFDHRSMTRKRPDVVTNDIGCRKRVRF